MSKKSMTILDRECYLHLLESSLKSVPFNMLVAFLLAAYLYFTPVPKAILFAWVGGICLISLIRLFNSKYSLKKYNASASDLSNKSAIRRFVLLTFIMGIAWGSAYILFLPYINLLHETSLILILGGMAAGSLASLSVYLIAYYAYLLPIFLPVIVYNYSLYQFDRGVLATTFLLFVVMLTITAKIASTMLQNTVKLTHELQFTNKKLKVINKKLTESFEAIKTMSITDSLTGLYNRRFFNEKIRKEYNRARRNKYPLNLVFIDIDNFKTINDTYGHPTGDKFLADVAKIIKEHSRRGDDTVFRLGGDEFAVIAANSSLEEVLEHFSSMKEKLKEHNNFLNVSLSIGVICVVPTGKELVDSLISAADEILYQAKKSGKDQIVSQNFLNRH